MAVLLYCMEPFIIIIPSSRYDFNNVERDIRYQPSLVLDSRE